MHRHSGIGLHTPSGVLYGRAGEVRRARAAVLNSVDHTHPDRFVRKPPEPPTLPDAVWINEPDTDTDTDTDAH
ncbi:hypothetical protein BH23ACT10_BH23ACT10_17190 [soil metagenome]